VARQLGKNLPANDSGVRRIVKLGQYDHEFVAAGARHRVFLAPTAGEAPAAALQQLVADSSPKAS